MSYPPQPPPPWQPGPPQRHQQRNQGLLLGGIALATALVVACGVLVWLLVDNGSGDSADDGHLTPAPTAPTTAPSTTAPPTTAPPSTSAPPSTEAPEDPNRIHASDFPGDWNFKFGDVALKATYLSSADYATCDPVAGPRLLDRGCQYAVRWTYRAQGGKLRLSVLEYVMDSAAHAKDAKSKLRSGDLKLPKEALLPSAADEDTYADASQEVLVVSVVTTTSGVGDDVATKYLRYSNADFGSALLFR